MKYVLGMCLYIAIFVTLQTSHAQVLDCVNPDNRTLCLAELAKAEKEIGELTIQLKSKKGEAVSIARDKAVLALQTKQAQLKIKAHEFSIVKLGKDIGKAGKNTGKTVAKSSKQVAKDVKPAAKSVGKETKKVAKDIGHETKKVVGK